MTKRPSTNGITGQRKYLNTAELRLFYNVTEKIKSLCDQTFCQTLLFSGCRPSEALELTPQSIDYSDQTLIFRTLKQHGVIRYRAVLVPEHLLDKLLEHVEAEGISDTQPLWGFCRTTGWKRVKRYMAEANIKGAMATGKGLRHTYAIWAVKEKIDLFTVQKWMGHQNAKTTSIYLDFVGEDQRELAQRMWKTLE